MTGRRDNVEPEVCKACNGKGTTLGVFHELDCVPCDGVGWLPMAGQDLTQQLGRYLTRQIATANVLRAAAASGQGAERDYQDSRRDGVRGHYTGD
ncbi:hypothetical protein CNQ84_00640 [Pseudomonas abyssi]|uniref:Uncharacterized protein n=1 Tax=Pseudomonas abyssi TaxID=170540 RepID=A0A2A3MM91_9PSED|nr:hypothetical protein [Pseudomonas abyssi]PBK05921.1 hypothetical protein CNQ84_00640 [Pseudomonas abyssi]